jgi:hypothetical protein
MIYMAPALFESLDNAEGLRAALQVAIRLEHATIPPYLYAQYSLDPAKNPRLFNLIRGVAKEEMAHFAIACNLLNAIGGSPKIDSPDFIVRYPDSLPGAINTGLQVSLAPFSLGHVKTVFMEIEEPEDPIQFKALSSPLTTEAFQTIGDFYRAIRDQIVNLGPGLFTGNPAKQVSSDDIGLPDVSPIVDPKTAVLAIEHIVKQGEGTKDLPSDDHQRLAHYYRFAEIYKGHELVKNPNVPPEAPAIEKYSYTGAPLAADPAGVYPLRVNPKAVDYPMDVRKVAEEFNATYIRMLAQLQRGFEGDLQQLPSAIETMQPMLRTIAMSLVRTPLGDGTNAGPTFEYVP